MLRRSWGGGFEQSGGQDGGSGFWLHAVTGDDGTYRIENVPAADYNARAMAFGYFPADPVPVTVADGETAEANFELQALAFGSLEGTVTDAVTGDPIEGAVVRIIPLAPVTEGLGGGGWGGGWHRTMTDENGYYRFDELAAGMVTVRVSAPGYLPAENEAEVVIDETSILDVALEPLAYGSLEGTITDATTGDPIQGVFVRAYCVNGAEGDGPGGWLFAITDENGHYSFDELGTGGYRVRAFGWGYFPGEAEVEVLEGETTVADIALEPFNYGINKQ